MENTKRVRGCNFMAEEKFLVINLVAKYKDIIENKKTDGVTNFEKNKAWGKIIEEFNTISPGNIHRTVDQLKRFYENKKKELRKKASEKKNLLKRTGGGPPPDDKKENYEELLLSLTNEKTVFGLPSQYDGDATGDEELDQTDDNQVTQVEFELMENNMDVDSSENDPETNTWKKFKPANLKEPVSTPLRQLSRNDLQQPSSSGHSEFKNKKSSSRRRPTTTVKALTSSDISQKYNSLMDLRLEIARKVKEQIEQEITQSKIKFEKKIELLNTKIECSKQEFNKMKEQ